MQTARQLSPVPQHVGCGEVRKLEPEDFSPGRTVLIFDWDDTLFPSSWVASNNLRLNDVHLAPETLETLGHVEAATVRLLSKALDLADEVLIITNAETGWVELSAQRFIPGVVPLLNRTRVVSARSSYEYLHPGDPHMWKHVAFSNVTRDLFAEEDGDEARDAGAGAGAAVAAAAAAADSGSPGSPGGVRLLATARPSTPHHVISLGDSAHERTALRSLKHQAHMRFSWTKSVKFMERPSTELLVHQIGMMVTHLAAICSHDDDLDVTLTQTDIDDWRESHAVGEA